MLPAALCLARYASKKWAEWHDARKFQSVRHSSRKPTGQDLSRIFRLRMAQTSTVARLTAAWQAAMRRGRRQSAVGEHAAFLGSHRRVHAGSVFGSRRPALAGHMREGARVSQRMLVFGLISAHANITPTRTMPSAQFISSRLLPSRKGPRGSGGAGVVVGVRGAGKAHLG